MNEKEEQELYDKLLNNKQKIIDNFKLNSDYNRTQKYNRNIMYDSAGLMYLSNKSAAKHNEEVRKLLPQDYEALMVNYVFIY